MMALRASLLALSLLVPAAALAQQNPNPSFNLVNGGAAPLKEFFAASAGRANWGRDRLDGKPLAPGGKFAVRLPADGNCIYDLKAVFADGRTEEKRGVNACRSEDIAFGATAPRAFRLKNSGTSPVTEVLLRVAGPGHKPTNLTQGSAIAPGAERGFDLPGTECVFDLRVTFENKTVREKRGADLCKAPEQGVQ